VGDTLKSAAAVTEGQFSNVIGQFPTWFQITQDYLPKNGANGDPRWPKWLRPFDIWNFQTDQTYGLPHPGRIPRRSASPSRPSVSTAP